MNAHGRQHTKRWRVDSTALKRIWDHIQEDDCFDLAAQMSFYFALSLFPFFLVLSVVIGWLPATTAWKSFATWIVDYFPDESRRFIFSTIMSLASGSKSILSFGLVAAVWSASSGFLSLMESLSIAYRCRDTRPYWRQRVIATGATFLAAIFAVACFGIVLLGHWGVRMMPLSLREWNLSRAIWDLLRWIVMLALLYVGVELMNFLLPAGKRTWRWLSPGTAFVVLTLVASTMGLNVYVKHFSTYPAIYGTLGGVIVLMLWIYVASIILLVGAEADHEIAEADNEIEAAGEQDGD
jgi:membrane protein